MAKVEEEVSTASQDAGADDADVLTRYTGPPVPAPRPQGHFLVRFWRSAVGKKWVMAITGILLLMLFCSVLQWLPYPSYVPFTEDPEQWAWNLALPWFALAFLESAKYARITRSSLLETLAEDHVRTFRAYGVGERAIVWRHALRGALPPVIALSAMDFGTMFGGADFPSAARTKLRMDSTTPRTLVSSIVSA